MKKSWVKPFVAPEGAVRSMMNLRQRQLGLKKFENKNRNLWCGIELTRPLQHTPHLSLMLAAQGYVSNY